MYQSKPATLFISVSGGFPLYSGDLFSVIQAGYSTRLVIGYLFQFDWADIGLGGMTGLEFFYTRDSVPAPYSMYSFPLAVHAQISSKFGLPFRLIAEAQAGVCLDSFFFQNETTVLTTAKVFLSAAFGIGNDLYSLVNISHFWGITIILFEDPVYFALNPGIRIEIKL
ncbi:MAG: hypothetical protein EHM28_09870 [Spirochaetaceae bacterium]|nr:MAG: hypothetical protein EHM28_09870 [Spirochaetaceae bacterium]